MNTVVLNLEKIELNNKQFYHLSQVNQDWQIERIAKEQLIIMPSVGGII